MIKILVTSRRTMSPDEEMRKAECISKLETLEDVEVVPNERVDWKSLTEAAGSWDGSAVAAMQIFHRLVVIEEVEGSGLVGRGQYTLVDAALRLQRPVSVWRGGRGERIQSIEIADSQNWKSGYGRMTCTSRA